MSSLRISFEFLFATNAAYRQQFEAVCEETELQLVLMLLITYKNKTSSFSLLCNLLLDPYKNLPDFGLKS